MYKFNIAVESAKKYGFNKSVSNNNKIIHFCWFGGGVLSELNIKCIESWKQYAGDYTFCLWDEDSFDINKIEFVKDAYQHKMWAFVSDFVRLWCIYNYGGIYFDTDVELISSIDNLPERFVAVESRTEQIALGLGFGAEKENGVIKDILTTYENTKFSKREMHKFLIPYVVTRYFYSHGYRHIRNELNNCMEFTIYPSEYFCPKDLHNHQITLTENTISIHHYEGSWLR